ncbi:MAG: secretin N-terminal domain-containing protein [Kiritimatiellia bacterium]
MKTTAPLLLALALCAALPSTAQIAPPLPEYKGQTHGPNYNGNPLEVILDEYSTMTGKSILKAPSLPQVTFTFKTPKNQKLTTEEYLLAIESMLSLNGITLVPEGDKFLRAIPSDVALKNQPIIKIPPEKRATEFNKMRSELMVLKHLEIDEVTPIIQELLNPFGKIQAIPRMNALLVTDTSANVARAADFIEHLDVPIEVREEVRVYELTYAKAADVAGRINELIAESQQNAQQNANRISRGAVSGTGTTAAPPSPVTVSTPGGVIRPVPGMTPGASAAAGAARGSYEADLAERGLVQGKVKIVPDERTNSLIIISRAENFKFFDKMIDVLDRKVDPEMIFEVIRLEFSDADEMSGMVGDLIGAKTSSTGGSSSGSRNSGGTGLGNNRTGNNAGNEDFPIGGSNNRNSRTGSSSSRTNSSNRNSTSSSSRGEGVREFLNRRNQQAAGGTAAGGTAVRDRGGGRRSRRVARRRHRRHLRGHPPHRRPPHQLAHPHGPRPGHRDHQVAHQAARRHAGPGAHRGGHHRGQSQRERALRRRLAAALHDGGELPDPGARRRGRGHPARVLLRRRPAHRRGRRLHRRRQGGPRHHPQPRGLHLLRHLPRPQPRRHHHRRRGVGRLQGAGHAGDPDDRQHRGQHRRGREAPGPHQQQHHLRRHHPQHL